jgi:hypothetical protein
MIGRVFSVLALAAAFLSGAILGPAAVNAVTAPNQDVSDHIRIAGCVIRLYSTGPVAYQNSAHACLGVTSVGMNSSGDVVIHRGGSTNTIVSCTAAIDESMAAKQILAGCSGGGVTSTIKLYKADSGHHVWASSAAVASPASNLWMTWIEYTP